MYLVLKFLFITANYKRLSSFFHICISLPTLDIHFNLIEVSRLGSQHSLE